MIVAAFVVAAPDVAAVFAGEVPDFPSVPTTTVGALDLPANGCFVAAPLRC